jgi:NADPH-dependent curcumin reductase CurA
MAPIRNAAVIFIKVPTGYPESDIHVKYVTNRIIDLDTVDTQDGIVVKNLVVSIDPYMRGRMRAPESKSYVPPFELNKPLTNFGVGKIIKSDNIGYKVGQLVYGLCGYEEYTIHSRGYVETFRIFTEAELKLGLPLTTWVGAAGMSGQTAFYSFYNIGEPKRGDTIFISGASGAVGQIVGQLGELFSVPKRHAGLFN